jgi:hypothetical protein
MAARIYNTAILPVAVGLDPQQLSYEVSWDKNNMPLSVNTNVEKPIGNTVTVKVTYQWIPELFPMGPFTLTSTSSAQMLY